MTYIPRKPSILSNTPWWLLAIALLFVLGLWGITADTTYSQIFRALSGGVITTVWVTIIAFAAATALGAPDQRILLKHALPNVVDVLVVFVSLGVASAILTEAGLSFLGLGVQPPQASWGNLLTAARELTVLEAYPWQWMPAGILIILTVLATNFLGDGLRDALDPKANQ